MKKIYKLHESIIVSAAAQLMLLLAMIILFATKKNIYEIKGALSTGEIDVIIMTPVAILFFIAMFTLGIFVIIEYKKNNGKKIDLITGICAMIPIAQIAATVLAIIYVAKNDMHESVTDGKDVEKTFAY